MLSPDFIYDLHRANDIVDIVEQNVALKKRGKTFSGLCPFHSEKTPSFTVYPDTESFYCFGCGKGGDVITYVMLRDNLSYIEAVRMLAERAGMQLPDDAEDKNARQKINILAANKSAARFFFEQLNGEKGASARAYLRGRALEDNTIKRFGIGYAPESWNQLTDRLRAEGFSDDDLITAGLCGKGRYGLYDMFRNRLMFPLIDLRGNVVGFSGRRLNEADERKYINTLNTPVFNKSRFMFALNIAKSNTSRSIILAEGQMDAISMHQAGFANAVAALGTALTEEHVRMISQYADEVVLAYDSDDAGQKAARRAIDLVKAAGLGARVLEIPQVKDADEYIKKFGALSFKRLVDEAWTSVEFELEKAKRGLDLDTDPGKVEYVKLASQIISRCDNETEREIYAARVSSETGVTRSGILSQCENLRKKRRAKEQKERENRLISNIGEDYRKFKSDANEGIGRAFAKRRLLGVLCANPDFCRAVRERLEPSELNDAQLADAYETICRMAQDGSYAGIGSLSGLLPQELYFELAGFLAKNSGVNFNPEDALYLVKKIKEQPKDRESVSQQSPEELMNEINSRKDAASGK